MSTTNVRVEIYVAFLGAWVISFLALALLAEAHPSDWKREWPRTDFSRSAVDLSQIMSGGPPKDGIPAIDDPRFNMVDQITDLGPQEPVITLALNRVAKAYPLRVLMWHEIANDTIGGVPVAVTYCPLCNASLVFDRRANEQVLDFGVSGKLRHSDLVMYDRQTESWWQQFLGEAIVGQMTGVALKRLPSRVIPFSEFRKAYPNGLVLIPPDPHARPYGENPYANYDGSGWPFLFRGDYDGPVSPLAYVVAVGQDAWPLDAIRKASRIAHAGIVITWQEGMNSALDARSIDQGRDLGYVTVQHQNRDGTYEDVPYDMTFAFVFKAFHPKGIIHVEARQ